MRDLKGLRIISDKLETKDQTIEFEIIMSERDLAIDTLVECLNAGSIITLTDRRQNREGQISLKKQKGEYFKTAGGHGFSSDWRVIDIKEVAWFIKVTAPFNYGDSEGENGIIKNS